ncbi:GNAT family N-acetyltransferase [Sneathia sanguinegens]|uniref:GNAT family N-acetyltransferase n=1 Tax=Sneathia sanguinegens TaxID=40543 RepID=A0ABT7HHL3_9FUSO|nr:GNAT family N-acetyltransferase [Sneathia sanguinegens]MDK9580009.1 GNAT family N-acetyltransferase [Sneathia sanguinegens]
MEIKTIVEIHNENFEKKVDLSYFESLTNIYNIYTIENKGYLILLDSVDVYEIFEIAVRIKEQSKGIGNKLMSLLPKDKDILLEVNEKNTKALALYKRQGFLQIYERKKYYGDFSAIIMKKVCVL